MDMTLLPSSGRGWIPSEIGSPWREEFLACRAGEGRIDQDRRDSKGELTPMLTHEQQQAYDEEGYLLVSGLIPPERAAEAEAAMWRLIDASPTEPASWTGRPTAAQSFESPELLACFTPEYLAAAAQLAGD